LFDIGIPEWFSPLSFDANKISMAQWNGQFGGLTHETKVHDIEESLHKAVAALASATETNRERKQKDVLHLSERLLVARLKVVHARISRLTQTGKQVAGLRIKEQELLTASVDGILKEFGTL